MSDDRMTESVIVGRDVIKLFGLMLTMTTDTDRFNQNLEIMNIDVSEARHKITDDLNINSELLPTKD